MCKFKSAIVLRNGDILHDPFTDSHEDLIQLFKLDDSDQFIERFVRVEFSPDGDDHTDLNSYQLKVDEDSTPDWFDELKDGLTEKMKDIVRPMIINEDRDIIVGHAVVLGEINVNRLVNCLVINAGYSTIQDAGYATIRDAGDATIRNAGRATIRDAWYATIQNAGCATIINKQNAKIL